MQSDYFHFRNRALLGHQRPPCSIGCCWRYGERQGARHDRRHYTLIPSPLGIGLQITRETQERAGGIPPASFQTSGDPIRNSSIRPLRILLTKKGNTKMSQPFLGEIRMFGGNFAPRGWAFCNGQILAIAQNTALFSLLGTTYGGNGQTTFALPDLRGRLPLNQGQGPGLSSYDLGRASGSETVTLLTTEMPAHTHAPTNTVNASARADSSTPASCVPADTGGPQIYASAPDGSTTMFPGMITTTVAPVGGSQPHANMQPYLVVSFIIATEGIFPSRN